MKRTVLKWMLLAVVFSPCLADCCRSEDAGPTMQAEAKRIVGSHRAVFLGPPKKIPSKMAVDAPLLGNGDMGVALSGPPEQQRFWLCKNDFWRLKHGAGSGPRVFGGIDLAIPGLAGATYRVEQFPYDGVTVGTFTKDKLVVTMRSWVAATENLLVVEITCQGGTVDGDAKLWVQTGAGSETEEGETGGTRWGVRKFTEGVEISTEAAAAAKLIGLDKMTFTAGPDKPVTLVVAMQSVFKSKSYLTDVQKRVSGLDAGKLERCWRDHTAWWHDFWARSLVEIPDKEIERQYYMSNYVMASCSRDPEFPPGLFGTWVTTDSPGWNGDYHLNYNHMAPYYGLYSSNHIEQADPYHAPIVDFMEQAREYAQKELKCRGVYYPVGIGPKGMEVTRGHGYDRRGDSSPGLFCGQKSNASYCLVNIASRWYATYDPEYAKELYPLVRAVADFWEDYVTWEESNNRYVIRDDAVHENTFGDFNPILSLGLVRNSLALAIDMSKELKTDLDRHEKWRHILDNLSTWTTQEKNGKTVFRYTEKGTPWWRNNTLGIQHIYPAGAIHLDSDPQLLRISRNTIEVMNRWADNNGMNSIFPAAVRVGYDPEVILEKLHTYVTKHANTNGWAARNPHGIENCSIVPNTINQMLCMGHKGVLRVFPVWPKDRDAMFRNLRAEGAFLVSGELRDGTVQYVSILSERGRDCTIVNPWPGKTVQVLRNGRPAETFSNDRATLKTARGQTLLLRPVKGSP